ncbi:MAG: hypothetical protein ACXADC_04220 [Candidatus Thorarchaeota archaeon]|jgi:hypothetical protein
MQAVPIPLEQVYFEAAVLCFYLMALNTLDWKHIYEMPSRAILGLTQITSLMLMFHAGLGIVIVVLEQLVFIALGWLILWGVLLWMNRIRIVVIYRGKPVNMK